MVNRTVELAVVGAGPKGMALAAKSFVLRELSVEVPDMLVIDESGVGAHWDGSVGYTDGEQLLVSPAEQDIGFPYHSTCWGLKDGEVDRRLSEFSLQQYLIAKGKLADWLIKGRSLNHRTFVDYMKWVAERIGFVPDIFQVKSIDIDESGRWILRGRARDVIRCNSLVITGSGPARLLPGGRRSDLILDGKDFWTRISLFDNHEKQVAVIGGGETAGAIAAAIARRANPGSAAAPTQAKIFLIHDQAAYYSRGQTWGETRWFVDPSSELSTGAGAAAGRTDWNNLKPEHRRQIISRADRGVVSVSVLQELAQSGLVSHVCGTVERVITRRSAGDLLLEISYNSRTEQIGVDCAVVAVGFDALWFLDVMTESAARYVISKALVNRDGKEEVFKKAVRAAGTQPTARKEVLVTRFYNQLKHKDVRFFLQRKLESKIDTDMSVQGISPRLHLPMLAGPMPGPGFPNLNCLGLLSDRILAQYC
jgi:mycobactin lysine-N-oxygenase